MKRFILASACLLGLSGAASAFPALTGFDGPGTNATGLTVDALGTILPLDDLLMRRGRGADDPAGDDRGRRRGGHGADDPAGHTMLEGAASPLELARRGADDGAGDDHGRRHGGHGADDAGTNGDTSGSGRKKPRIPGGSGCDDAGDIEEHAGCRG